MKISLCLSIVLFSINAFAAVPIADFDWTPENPGVNETVQFNDRSSGATSTLIYVENSHPQAGPTAFVRFNQGGVYEMKIVATNASGSSEKIRWVNVGRPPEARMTVSATRVKVGEPIAFSDRSTGLVTSTTWSFGDGTLSTSVSPTKSYTAAGTYTVTLTSRTSSGPALATQAIVVESVAVAPTANFTWSPPAPKVGETVQFSDLSTGAPTAWSWSFGDGATSAQQSPSHAYTAAGTYTVSLTVSNASGSNTSTKQIGIVADPTQNLKADFDFADFQLAGRSVRFTDKSAGTPSSWSWNFGDDEAPSSERSPAHVFRRAGVYPVTLVVRSGSSTDFITKRITIRSGEPVKAAFDIFPAPVVGEPTHFVSRATGPVVSQTWKFKGGRTVTGSSVTHTFGAEGDEEVELTVTDGVVTDTAKQIVRVAPKPVQTPTAHFSMPTSALVSQTIAFRNLSSDDAVSFQWTFGDGATSTARTPGHSYSKEGDYTVTLTARNNDGKTAKASRTIRIDDPKPPKADFSWSPTTPVDKKETQFTNASDERAIRFEWSVSPGPGVVSTARHLRYTFPEARKYEVTLRATTALGVTGEIKKTLDVKPSTALVASLNCVPERNDLVLGSVSRVCGNEYYVVRRYKCFADATGNPSRWTLTSSTPRDDRGNFESPLPRIPYEYTEFVGQREGALNTSNRDLTQTLTVYRDSDNTVSSASVTLTGPSCTTCGATVYPPSCVGNAKDVALKSDFRMLPPNPRVGDEVIFTDTSTGSPIYSSWLIDGKDKFTGSTLRHKFLTAGQHNVSHEVFNGSNRDAATRSITVQAGDGPEFKKVESQYGDCYYTGHPVEVQIDAAMDWKGVTPAFAKYRIHDGPEKPATIEADQSIRVRFPSSDLLQLGKGGAERNTIKLTAQNTSGVVSTYEYPLYALESSSWLNGASVLREPRRYTFTNVLKFPLQPWQGKVTLPPIRESWKGKEIGLEETQATFQRSLKSDCTTESTLSGMTGFDALGLKFRGEVHGKHTMQVSQKGIIDEGGVIGAEIAGGGTGPEIDLFTWVPAFRPICLTPKIEEICRIVKVKEEFFLRTGFDVKFYRLNDSWSFEEIEVGIKPEGKVGLSAKVSNNIGVELSAGASFDTKWRFVRPPYFIGSELKFVGGGKMFFYIFEYEKQFGIICSFAAGGVWSCSGQAASKGVLEDRGPLSLRPMPIAEAPERAIYHLKQRGEATVVTSLSKVAAPSAAESGGAIVAVYVSENPNAANPLHRTDLRYVTLRDGVWSEPKAVATDDLAEFAPALVTASDGRVVAIWQRVKNAALRLEDIATTSDLPKINREVEIIASIYSPASGTWSAPVALTDNAVFDHDAAVVALSNGRVIALWLRDPGNDSAGTPANPTQLVARVWNGTEWSAESVVATGMFGVEGLSGSARGTSAAFALSRDKDGNLENDTDREIAVITYDGSWSTVRDLTNDSTNDYAPRIAFGSDGARVLWLSGDDLVWQPVSGGTREVIRDSQSGALLNATVAANPAGHLFVVWSESIAGTTDVAVRSYDPSAKKWSDDIPLTRNDAVESSLSAFFTSNGKLQVVGLETETKYADVTRIVDGKEVVFPNTPQPGAISLLHLDKAIVVDLAVVPNTVTTSKDSPSDGETIRLTADLHNAGDLPVRDAAIIIYSGRGTTGEVLARDKVAGDWNAGSTRRVEVSFPYSSKAEEVTFAVDPLGETGDRLQSNNSAVFSYRNAPPLACMQVSRMIGTAPLTVTFDASCSTDADGRIALTRWSLGNGVAATGTTATHTFTASGVYPVTATVIDDLGRSSNSTVEIYVNTLGDPRVGEAVTAPLILPVVGRTAGAAGTFFVSDATIFNGDEGTDLVVEAMFLPDGRLDFHYATMTIPPNGLVDLADLVAQTFHAGGVGWARFDVSHPRAVITSRTYNNQPTGTAGTFVPAVTEAEAVRAGSRRVFLQEWRDGYRVNLGLTEIAGDGGLVTVSAYDESGALAGTRQYAIAPWQRLQINGDALYQRTGRIEVTTDGGEILAFTTTNDNRSGDPVYQAGVELTGLQTSTRWLVPTVGRVRGAFDTDFRSDVRVFNASTTQQSVRLTLTLADRAIEKRVNVRAGNTARFDDIITSLFTEITDGAIGSLTIEADAPLVVTARTYNQTSKGTFGVATPPRLTDQLLNAGERANLIQLRNDAAYRCNFGATAGPDGTELLIRGYNEKGDVLGERRLGLGANQNLQISRIFESFGVTTPLGAARLGVTVVSGSAYVYATVVDNKTGDGTFVEAAR